MSSSPARTIIRPCDSYHRVITTGPPDWRPHPRRCCTGPAPNRISVCVQAGSQTRTRLRSSRLPNAYPLAFKPASLTPYPCHCERRTPVIAIALSPVIASAVPLSLRSPYPLSLRAPYPCHCERRTPVIASAVPLSLRAPYPCHRERRTPVIANAVPLSSRTPYPCHCERSAAISSAGEPSSRRWARRAASPRPMVNRVRLRAGSALINAALPC